MIRVWKFCLIGLLILSGDVKINPGPMMLSGGFSADEGSALLKSGNFPVRANQRGVQCDVCQLWLHVQGV